VLCGEKTMSDIVIQVEGLSKLYRIGRAQQRHDTLRDAIVDFGSRIADRIRSIRDPSGVPSAIRQPQSEEFIWALKDVSFEVRRGEVLGIIGRNGAGKSTLLKILSRITEPTEGRAIVRGRVGSLLEVGTGFHPELTGRENIYLNGAILGMKKAEIDRKFDEIVAFAEIEKFLDTPVKRYSSGMYVRLAFAVAAHLEPEILLVDEVLAVGDAQFQKKCLGKMSQVAGEGRTVLFVSHNMTAVKGLCKLTMLIEAGKIVQVGDPATVVARYLTSSCGTQSAVQWSEDVAPGNDELRLLGIRVYSENGDTGGVFSSSSGILVEMRFTTYTLHPALCVGFDLTTSQGEVIARSYQTDMRPDKWPRPKLGHNVWRCRIPPGLLNAGLYQISPRIGLHNMYWIVNTESVIQFEVILDHSVSPFWHSLDSRSRPGVIAPILEWEISDGDN
jgi:lipopolysaccharide transport system ATP-binding protein